MVKQIGIRDAKAGDWLVGNGTRHEITAASFGEVRIKTPITDRNAWLSPDTWESLGFHAERDEPATPQVMKGVVTGYGGMKLYRDGKLVASADVSRLGLTVGSNVEVEIREIAA